MMVMNGTRYGSRQPVAFKFWQSRMRADCKTLKLLSKTPNGPDQRFRKAFVAAKYSVHQNRVNLKVRLHAYLDGQF